MHRSTVQAAQLRRRQVITAWLVAALVAGVSIITGLNEARDDAAKQAGRPSDTSKSSGALVKPHDFYGVVEVPEEDDSRWVCWVHSRTGC